jgi:hypothetical protein
MIVLAGLGGALILDLGIVRPVLSPSDLALAATGIALYAGLVLMLTTAFFVIGLRRIRFGLSRNALTRDRWIALFAETGLDQLATRIVDLVPAEGAAWRERLVLQSRFDAGNARRETRHLYRDWLVRTSFFTAFALLLTMIGLAWIQKYARISISGIGLQANPIVAAVLALAIFGALGRLAVDTAVEPMLDRITKLSLERLDIGLLRTLTDLAERARTAPFPGSAPVPAVFSEPILERLFIVFEGLRDSLHNSTTRLAANADLLATTARALSEGRTEKAEMPPDLSAVAELKATMEALTVAIERLPGIAQQTLKGPVVESHSLGSQTMPNDELGRELRELLKEFEQREPNNFNRNSDAG